jgi:hypothetical protein
MFCSAACRQREYRRRRELLKGQPLELAELLTAARSRRHELAAAANAMALVEEAAELWAAAHAAHDADAEAAALAVLNGLTRAMLASDRANADAFEAVVDELPNVYLTDAGRVLLDDALSRAGLCLFDDRPTADDETENETNP